MKTKDRWKQSKTPFLDMVQGLPGGNGYLSDSEVGSDQEVEDEFFVLPELLGTSDLKSLRDLCIKHKSELGHRFYEIKPLF